MEMQIHLSFDDQATLQNGTETSGARTAQSGTRDRGSGSPGHQDFSSNMQIRVQLQDSFGANLDESSPNREGKLTFRVCNRITYKIRIIGPEIEESITDNVEPGRGDRLLNISIRHKDSRQEAGSNAGSISATRLQIPRNAQKELDKGNAALAKGDLQGARQSFEKAIALYPDFDQAYNNLGVIFMQTGDSDAGKKAFEKAIEVNDHFARAYVNLAKIAIDAREFSKAYEFARKALATEPLNPSSLFVGAEAAFFSGSFGDTVAYTKTLHSLPHDGMGLAHFLSGRSLQAQNLPADAISEYELFIKEDPADPNVPKALQAISQLRASLP